MELVYLVIVGFVAVTMYCGVMATTQNPVAAFVAFLAAPIVFLIALRLGVLL